MSDQLQVSSERVSALADGELMEDEFILAMDDLADKPETRDTWDVYHLVGEAMRSSGAPLRAHDPDFVVRLRSKLEMEIPKSVATNPFPERATARNFTYRSAANDPWWRRVAGLASIALVGVLAWQGLTLMGAGQPPQSQNQLAQSPAPAAQVPTTTLVKAEGAPSLMIRDPQLDALLTAHRQLGGATALQMPSGFLRNATFNEDRP